jgi:hypothetical protein
MGASRPSDRRRAIAQRGDFSHRISLGVDMDRLPTTAS